MKAKKNMNPIYNKLTLITLIVLFISIIFPIEVFSQALPPPPPPPPGGGPPCWPPPCIPINKGLIFLAIAAFLLATYQLKIFRTKTK